MSWEDRYYAMFEGLVEDRINLKLAEDIKSFIASELSKQREELIAEIKKLKQDWKKKPAINGLMWNAGYNEALEEIIVSLSKEKK